MNELKVLVAESSLIYKKIFMQAVAKSNINISITCVSNADGVMYKIDRNNYDIVIIDAETPGFDVETLLKYILSKIPRALILIMSRPSPVNKERCARALAAGAADCIIKPIYKSYDENVEAMRDKLDEIYGFLYDRNKRTYGQIENKTPKTRNTFGRDAFRPHIILIAASTGGPLALETIFNNLRGDLPAPVLTVQHMPAYFTETLAHHLDRKSLLKIKIAEEGEIIKAGTVYMAPGGVHMKLNAENRIILDNSLPINGIRPAADILFNSVAEHFADAGILAVILTGMGRDGENGLAELKEKCKCFCIAQSEKTCVVYGMPRAASERGFADKVLDLREIPTEIESFYFARKIKEIPAEKEKRVDQDEV